MARKSRDNSAPSIYPHSQYMTSATTRFKGDAKSNHIIYKRVDDSGSLQGGGSTMYQMGKIQANTTTGKCTHLSGREVRSGIVTYGVGAEVLCSRMDDLGCKKTTY